MSTVLYQGRDVPKEGFRVFIYNREGLTKLVNSWISYDEHINTGNWFSTKEEAQKPIEEPKIQRSKKRGES